MRTLKEIEEALKSVLCNPEGKCCIRGSDGDREVINKALTQLSALRDECVMVPREPSAEMANAAVDATNVYYTAPHDTGWYGSPQSLFVAAFRAMITAVEKATQTTEENKMKTLKEIEDQIAELQKEKEVILSRPINGWKRIEDIYSTLPQGPYKEHKNTLIAHGLAFKTQEEAKLYAEMMQSALEIRGPEPVDWGKSDIIKYNINWEHVRNRPIFNGNRYTQYQGTFHFHTEEQARTMIDKWGDKLKLWVQGGVR